MARLNYSALKKSIFEPGNEDTIKDVIQKGIDEESPVDLIKKAEEAAEQVESVNETEPDNADAEKNETENQTADDNDESDYDESADDASESDEAESDSGVQYSNYGSSMIDDFQNKARAYKEGNSGNAVTVMPDSDIDGASDDIPSYKNEEEQQSAKLSSKHDDSEDVSEEQDEESVDDSDEKSADNPVKSKPQVKHRVYPKYKSDADIAKSALRDFPTDMATYIKDLFNGEAKTMSDAVAAYVYLKGDLPPDIAVPERIKDLSAHYIGETVTNNDLRYELRNEIRSLKVLINDLKTANRDMMQKMCDVELATVYSVFEKLGFSTKQADAPEDTDFLEIGVTDMERRLESQSKNRREREKIAKGRPIK